MTEIRNTYVRGYFISKYNEEKNSFENILLISEPTQLLNTYLKLLKETFKFFFENEIKDEHNLKLLNDLFVLLTYGSLSIPWQEMIRIWLESRFEEDKITNFMKNHFENFSKITNKFYETFPADDRPGLNTSSLLIHLISTSALATCIFIQYNNLDDNNLLSLQYIRTSSFFHDIGKPLSKRHHVKKSVELFRSYFTDLFSKEILENIIHIIEGHHKEKPSGETQYVKWGDNLSSASDRNTELVKSILSNKIDGIDEYFNDHNYWEKNENVLPELTDFFIKNYEKELKSQNIIYEYQEEKEIALIRGDIRRIHEYIDHVDTLTELRNSSRLLDQILSVYLVKKLVEDQEYTICPENIIYSSGGNILLFSSGKKAEKITNFLEKEFYVAMKEGLEMTTEFITFDRIYKGSFGDLYSKLAIKIGTKKNDLIYKAKTPILLGSSEICNSCGKKMATKSSREVQEEKKYCESCLYKYELPDMPEIKIQMRWEREIKSKFSDLLKEWSWKEISPYVMEFISGVSLENIKEKKIDPINLAVINSDGNLIGEFIGKSISLSDLYSRIIHISNTIIRMFENIEDRLKELHKEEDVVRLEIGRLYTGGDDILLLVPAYLAIPISLTLTKEFYKAMGKKVTLSTGIFSCGPKFPIWIAIETASSLLKNAKILGRQIKEEDNEIGAIDFQSHFSGIYLPSVEIRNYYTNRPFKVNRELKDSPNNKEIHYLLNNMVDLDHQVNIRLEENYDNLYNFIYDELKILNPNIKSINSESILKDFRNKAKKIESFFTFPPKNFVEEKQKAISFILYSTSRQKRKIGKETYIKLFNLIGDHFSDDPTLLFDAIEILRFLTGGWL